MAEADALPAPLRPVAADPGHSALFLDFDGTLSAIVEDPAAARPLPGVPALLARLATRVALVAVISGRPTAFLAEVFGAVPGVELVGLYGLERSLSGSADGARWVREVDGAVAEAKAAAPADVFIEPKGLTVTLNWRHAPEARPWAEGFAQGQEAERGLRASPGRKSLELRPPVDVDKGSVVRALVAEHEGGFRQVAAFGDDLGDLPAFDAVGELGTPGSPVAAVRVAAVDGESPGEVARRADITVPGAAGAVALLEDLDRAIGAGC